MIILANHTAIAIENAHLYETMAIKTEVLDNIKNYLSNVLQGMSNGVLAVNEEGKIELINKNTEDLFSLSEIDPTGYHLLEVFADSFGVKLHELYKKIVAEGGEISDEFEIKKEDGTKIPVSVKCNQLKDEEGHVKGAIFVFQDMSETYELIKLRKIDRLKDQLISNISHELRTPLTAIKSFSEILLNYDENEETKKEFLTIINSESDRLTRLINNILDLSKLESGTAKWQLEPLQIEMVIDSAVDTLQSLLMRKKIKLVKKYAGELPPVFADHDKLTQVIVNLVNNAIKYSPEGGKIIITTELLPETKKRKQAYVKVGVIDQGPGIPEKYLDVIFEKFGQVMETDDGNKPTGTGLGLTISREIIQHLGGRIWVESKPGKGASFYFELPVMPEDASNVDEIYEKEKITVVQHEKVIQRQNLQDGEVHAGEEHESESNEKNSGDAGGGQ
ncbi:MAG: ATP-binding protein [candidate division KSB1 bacterium]|nr:ATP-binding protein [candidate division KSB1 bacterium]